MVRSILPDSKLRARRRRRQIILACLSGALLILLFVGSVFLSRAAFLRITDVRISGALALNEAMLASTTREHLAGTYLFLFPKNNILLYPKESIREALVTTYPTIRTIDVRAENLHTVGITIVERNPRALWCGADVFASSTCFLLDESGLAYAEGNTVPEYTFVSYYGALGSGTLPRQYMTPQLFYSLAALVDSLAKRQTPDTVESVYVNEEHDVRVKFSTGFELIFSANDDSGDVYDRFGLALQTEVFAGRPVADFLYLDLRHGDHLYYKLKTATTATTTKKR